MREKHYFIAVSLPEEVKRELYEISVGLKERFRFKKWVHEADYHLTLAFLGASEIEKWENCMYLLAEKLQALSSFNMSLNHFDTFGLKQSPRIFWCGPAYNDSLFHLQALVVEACRESGYHLDEKPFHPHVTIARKYVGEADFTEENLRNCSLMMKDGIEVEVTRISLFETHMDQIPKYKEIRSIYI